MTVKISLIMATLNVQDFVAEALDSVAAQNYPHDIEVVVADGGSHDDTRDIVARYDFVRLLEGTDLGIYDGFNRGVASADGNVLGFLNADDLLPSGSLALIHDIFSDAAPPAFISGGITQGCGGQKTIVHTRPLSTAGAMFGIPAINGRYFTAQTVAAVGAFHQDAGLAADREFLVRLATLGLTSRNITAPLYHYRVHAGSATLAGDNASRQRVWGAEIQLADFLLTEAQQGTIPGTNNTANIVKTARQSRALARFKKWTFERRAKANGHADKQNRPALAVNDLKELPAAILAWRQWRGVLSGY